MTLKQHSEDHVTRQSNDKNGGITHFGEEFIHLASRCGMVICNGIPHYPQSGAYTCYTNMGSSVVDYLLMEADELALLRDFQIDPLLPESDHTPLFFQVAGTQGRSTPHTRDGTIFYFKMESGNQQEF
eukprot:c29395_g1_i1 orf=628-1011(+)